MASVISSLNGDPGKSQEIKDKSKWRRTKKAQQKSPNKRGVISEEEKNMKSAMFKRKGDRITGKGVLSQPGDSNEWSYCENKEKISERLQPDRASGTSAGQTEYKAYYKLDTVENNGMV